MLDLGLPDLDGVEVCRRIRAERPRRPVLILTARARSSTSSSGWTPAPTTTCTKPFRLAELLARVRALLRRGRRPTEHAAAGGRPGRSAARRAWRDGRELELTPKEFDLLALLVARRRARSCRRERIMSEVWDENWFGSTKTLDMHISWLRRKLGDDAATR